ncbi:unnamed protein product [Spirodela intermedia]|uniref:Sof1-like protein domain-containing protein n=1 Tax=Spirodela intermedia TaxID=51605 RepID=A0ABN7EAQ2_SPIIN|nr:unnamed protein product [Spirodela intermedia]
MEEIMQEFFTRPFVGTIDGHVDGVLCMAKNLISALFVSTLPGRKGASILISCGTDCIVRQWSVPITGVGESEDSSRDISEPLIVSAWKHKNKPVRFYVNFFRGADHQWNGNIFATAGAQVGIWDHNRSEPLNTFGWGNDTFDRSIVTYDLRMSSPVRKLIMKANEDCNCYSYDARKLDEAKCVHQEHVSVVMDIDYSPTGREFVTGSYGRTVRIFQYNGGRNREIYHTKRMQSSYYQCMITKHFAFIQLLDRVTKTLFTCGVFCVKYSCDGTYLISGSDDTNLRLWKTKASEQPGVVSQGNARSRSVLKRNNHLPEVNRIVRHRHLPKPIYKAANLRRTMIEADRTKRREEGPQCPRLSISAQPYRKRRIIREVE